MDLFYGLRRVHKLAVSAMNLGMSHPQLTFLANSRQHTSTFLGLASLKDPNLGRQILQEALDLFALLRAEVLRLSDEHARASHSQQGSSMSQTIVDLYREEARRQAQIALEIVDGAMETQLLVPDVAPDGGVDRVSLARLRDTLEQEIDKLGKNEATVAVIGAMKSGKSTSINAIIGSELVPSRDKPMTTFPTIVSHKAGKAVPHLEFHLAGAFSQLAVAIGEHLRDGGAEIDTHLASTPGAEDLVSLAGKVREGSINLPVEAVGYDDIRSLLVEVNDLSRLAQSLGVSRAVVDDALTFRTVPRIEVEFEHLTGIGGSMSGTLSLIDTPGPDEAADSQRLGDISREQLERASAIILVVNYRLIGGEAAEKLHKLLDLLPEQAWERLFVFANHYDLREQQTDDADEALVAAEEQLRLEKLKASVGAQVFGRYGDDARASAPSRVFPTSSRQALLANQARRAIRLDGALSRNKSTKQFRSDVGAIYGREWRQAPDFTDPTGVLEGAQALWQESRFDQPLSTAIETAARNSSIILVQSCLDKLKGGEMARLFELLEIKFGAFGAKTDELRTLISNLSADLTLLQDIERKARSRVEQVTEEVEPQLNAHFTRVLDAVEQIIDAYMSSGSPESARTSGETARKGVFDFLNGFLPRLSRRERLKKASAAYAEHEEMTGRSSAISSAPDFSNHLRWGSRERIEVDSAEEAQSKSAAIFDAFQAEFEQSSTDLLNWTKVALEEVLTDAKDGVDSSFREGWCAVQEHIAEVINVTISPPDIEVNLGNKAVFDELVRQRGHATRRVGYDVEYDRPGAGAATQRIFGSIASVFGFSAAGWGRATRTAYSNHHYIEIGLIRDEIKKQSNTLKDELFVTVKAYLRALDISLEAYADEVKNKVEQIHRFICEERNQREGDAANYALLCEQVSALAAQAHDLKQEAVALRIGVR